MTYHSSFHDDDYVVIGDTLYHPRDLLFLSDDEIKTLYQLLEHEYISYENDKAHELIKKISQFLKEHELAQANSRPA